MSPAPVELDGQYRALLEAAGALERAERRSLQITGPEAVEYLQGQLTNEIEALEPGQGSYAALLDRKGHMQADMRVLRTDDGLRLDTEPAGGDAVVRHLGMYKVGREVAIVEVTDRLTVISVIGPAAAELVLGGPVGPEHSHREAKLGGVACVAVSTDLGVDLLAPRAEAPGVLTALGAAGAEPVTEAATEIVRVEGGRPRFGHEMTTATIPQEAGINDRAVSFTKGCYIGQETVARLHYRGKPNRHLRGLRLAEPAADGDPVRLGERELGTIGTAVISPARGPIALAILRREAEPGIAVEVGEGLSAEVVELPF